MAEKFEKKIDTAAIRAAMLARWADPEYAIMWEVGNATGAQHTRFADAVIMSLWPSRGLELHGVEIKVSKYDWKREAADPSKAETIAAYCDRWWIHTSPNVIGDLSELPPAWGWREFDGKQWVTRREAEKTEAKTCDRRFLAALLRRADTQRRNDIHQAAQSMIDADRAQYDERVRIEVERRTHRAAEALERLQRLEDALGFKLDDWNIGSDAASVGAICKTILKGGVSTGYNNLANLVKLVGESAIKLDDALRDAGLSGIESDLAIIRDRFSKKKRVA